MSQRRKRPTGFTLIELMIVVAIIAVIAAIAIPNLLRSRVAANEASAIAVLRILSEAQSNYRDTSGTNTFGTINQLSTSAPPYLDPVVAVGVVQGYQINLIGVQTADLWAATAVPTTPGSSGVRSFYVDETGLIRFAPNGVAPTNASQPLQ